MDPVMSQSNPLGHEHEHEADLHGALIDEQGREIPITEAMILRACRELEHGLPSPWAGLPQNA